MRPLGVDKVAAARVGRLVDVDDILGVLEGGDGPEDQ